MKYVGDTCTVFGNALITGVQQATATGANLAVKAHGAMVRALPDDLAVSYKQGVRIAKENEAADKATTERQITLDNENPVFSVRIKYGTKERVIPEVRGYNNLYDILNDRETQAEYFKLNGVSKILSNYLMTSLTTNGIRPGNNTLYLSGTKGGGKKKTKKLRKTTTKRRKMARRHKGTKRRV